MRKRRCRRRSVSCDPRRLNAPPLSGDAAGPSSCETRCRIRHEYRKVHGPPATSATTGEATAFVSLFGSLNFGIALGTIDGLVSETVVVFIDPQADHPPDDIQTTRHHTILIEVIRPEPSHAYLAKTVSEGTGQMSLQEFLGRIEEWKFAKEMAPVLDRLNGVRALPAPEQKDAIAKIVHEQASRVYRIMRHVTDRFAEAKKKGTGPERKIIIIFKIMITVNAPPGPTFNEDGERVMIASLNAVTNALNATLAVGGLDMNCLWSLFSGDDGVDIVGKIVLASATKSFPE